MRSLVVVLVLAACTEHGRGGGDGIDPDLTDPDKPPASCGCLSAGPPLEGPCCATNVCFFDEDAGQWQIAICDELPAPGAPS